MKIENRKHCSKIIFKCVYSAVGPIFNEKVAEKCVNSNFCPPAEVQRKKKKKAETHPSQNVISIHTAPQSQ